MLKRISSIGVGVLLLGGSAAMGGSLTDSIQASRMTVLEVQKDTGRVFCHREEVIQAVSLVLENAAESEEGRHGEVRIRASADRARVLLEIADDGPGIDALARRRLFRPFWTTKPGHRGLGLYFARIIVERNDGGIEIGRGESGGTVVRIAFPRIAEEG